MNKKVAALIVIVIIVVGGLFVFNYFLKKNVVPEASTGNQTQVQNTLDVPDQAGGQEFFINSVSSKNGGFVVIYRDNNGTPGTIIGVSPLIAPGATMKNLRFTLNEAVKEGDIVYAALHQDNGDGVFDASTDSIAKDASGNPLMKRVTILSQGSLDNEVKL
jgi:hypothetical protein